MQKLAQFSSVVTSYTYKLYGDVRRAQEFIIISVTIEGGLDALLPVSPALAATGRMQDSAKNSLFN